jgi:putative transposase
VHRWAIKLLPALGKAFGLRKQKVGRSWRMDDTYIKIKGEWKYLYRAVDKAGDTVDFLLRAKRARPRPGAISKRRSLETAYRRV